MPNSTLLQQAAAYGRGLGLLPYAAPGLSGVGDPGNLYDYFKVYASAHYPELLFVQDHRVVPDPIGPDWVLELSWHLVRPDGLKERIDEQTYFNRTGGHGQWADSLVDVTPPANV